jgi:hypothetical protein
MASVCWRCPRWRRSSQKLAAKKVKLNITAPMTLTQVRDVNFILRLSGPQSTIDGDYGLYVGK